MRSSSARSAAARSPPIAEPPIPATVMLRTSAYAGGSVALVAIFQPSRTCAARPLIRSSMFPGSAARMRSTVSIMPVSRSVVVLAVTTHHPLAGVEHRLHFVLGPRLGVHPDERLGPRETHQQPRAILDEPFHAVVRVERHGLLHAVAGELAGLRGVQTFH